MDKMIRNEKDSIALIKQKDQLLIQKYEFTINGVSMMKFQLAVFIRDVFF